MRLAVAACLLVAGCAQLDAAAQMQSGNVRIDPHPNAPGAYRVTAIAMPDAPRLSGVEPHTPEARRRLVAELLGPRCETAEEARIPMAANPLGWRREQVLMRVTCP